MGNSQEGAADSDAGGPGAGFELGLVCPCARPGSVLMARKKASSSDVRVVIEIITLSIKEVPGIYGPVHSKVVTRPSQGERPALLKESYLSCLDPDSNAT